MSKKRPRVSLRSALRQTDTTAMYPACGTGTGPALAYVGLGLAGEAGEVANQLKKVMRDDHGLPTPSRSAKLFDELGDVLWYWLRCCRELGFDPYDVVLHNLTKLELRATKGEIQGDTAADGTRVGPALESMLVEDDNVPSGYAYAFGDGFHEALEKAYVGEDLGERTAPVFPAASLEQLQRMGVTLWPGRTAFVVDEGHMYAVGKDLEWHPVDSLANTIRGVVSPVQYDDLGQAYRDLVVHEQKPGPEEPGSSWGPRVLHVLTCACVCAVSGTPWVVSGYRELGVVQDMYAHLREVHATDDAVLRQEKL